MYCIKCGRKLEWNANFCTNCGFKMSEIEKLSQNEKNKNESNQFETIEEKKEYSNRKKGFEFIGKEKLVVFIGIGIVVLMVFAIWLAKMFGKSVNTPFDAIKNSNVLTRNIIRERMGEPDNESAYVDDTISYTYQEHYHVKNYFYNSNTEIEGDIFQCYNADFELMASVWQLDEFEMVEHADDLEKNIIKYYHMEPEHYEDNDSFNQYWSSGQYDEVVLVRNGYESLRVIYYIRDKCITETENQLTDVKEEGVQNENVQEKNIGGEITEQENGTENNLSNYTFDSIVGLYDVLPSKFWVHSLDGFGVDGTTEGYVLVDCHGNIYDTQSLEGFGDWHIYETIDENTFLVTDNLDTTQDINLRIVDRKGNDVSQNYIGTGEIIMDCERDDGKLLIFTTLVQDTPEYQELIFKIYCENEVIYSFSKSEINEKCQGEYDSWECDYRNLYIDNYKNHIFRMKANYSVEDDVFIDVLRGKIMLDTIERTHGIVTTDKYILSIMSPLVKKYNLDLGEYEEEVIDLRNVDENCTCFSNVSEDILLIYDEPLNYTITKTKRGCAYMDGTVFFTQDNCTEITRFHNGKAMVAFENDGGTPYVSIIDNNGDYVMEPILGTIWNSRLYYGGVFIICDENSRKKLVCENGNMYDLYNVLSKEDILYLQEADDGENIVYLQNGNLFRIAIPK